MYRRYSQVNEGYMPDGQKTRNRIKNVIILLLTAAVIALCVIGIPALQSKNGARNLYISRMQTECSDAVRQATVLSRNAGADSALILSRIRSSISAVTLINELSIGQDGPSGRLINEEEIQAITSTIDQYLSFLTTGMDTGEYQTNLQNTLYALQERLNSIN